MRRRAATCQLERASIKARAISSTPRSRISISAAVMAVIAFALLAAARLTPVSLLAASTALRVKLAIPSRWRLYRVSDARPDLSSYARHRALLVALISVLFRGDSLSSITGRHRGDLHEAWDGL
ncbi:hypothetical protein KCP73_12710 [Salmonella enterica subsp. enterica]|nr:hypothetical protein KCP73_12710 [Salmonella enterica subsp. enterica]